MEPPRRKGTTVNKGDATMDPEDLREPPIAAKSVKPERGVLAKPRLAVERASLLPRARANKERMHG